jgi:FAD/FMN-containing dehydrogenase
MSQLPETSLPLRAASDTLVHAGDPMWDDARRAWNLAVDQQPAAVALPRTVEDVVAVIRSARTTGRQIAVQATGHFAAAHGPLDETVLVNLAHLTGVEVDVGARRARVRGGTHWIDVVEAAAKHGLTALHGSAKDVGVVGYTLGGGVGWLARKYGLASSSVVSAEVVTADGAVRTVDAETNADLFWALRGGGEGIGVVTQLELELYPVRDAYAGWLIWPVERAVDVLDAWSEWTAGAPDEVTSIGRLLQIPPLPEMPEPLRGRQVVVVEAAYLGDEASGRELLRPLRELGPEIDTFAVAPALALTELHQDPPQPVPGRGDGWMLDALDADAAARLHETAGMDGTSPLISVEVRHLEGALGRTDPRGGALARLAAPYVLYAVGVVTGPDAAAAIDERIASLRTATERWRSGHAFPNFAERAVAPAAFYPDGVYERLLEIRREIDPDGLFRSRRAPA